MPKNESMAFIKKIHFGDLGFYNKMEIFATVNNEMEEKTKRMSMFWKRKVSKRKITMASMLKKKRKNIEGNATFLFVRHDTPVTFVGFILKSLLKPTRVLP